MKVAAKILVEDKTSDIAVLRFNTEGLDSLCVLPLATESDTMIFEGERVIAIGSPLNQIRIVTSGIVSKVEKQAIISDVNINPGNSGGPLINMNGEVVAINTFAEPSPTVGPGVSGSIRISVARPFIARAESLLVGDTSPPSNRLPIATKRPFPIDAIQNAVNVSKFDEKPYRVNSAERFQVVLMTPVYAEYRQGAVMRALSKKRGKREAQAGLPGREATDPFADLHEWLQYVGEYVPVVSINVRPEIGETGGSAFLNILGAMAAGYARTVYRGAHKMEFKADLNDFELFRNGTQITEIVRGMIMMPLYFYMDRFEGSYSGEDLARAGLFQFDPWIFRPEGGMWPRIELRISDLKHPNDTTVVVVPAKTIKRIWEDFLPYYNSIGQPVEAAPQHDKTISQEELKKLTPLVESRIVSTVTGFKPGTIFELKNGQVWQQVSQNSLDASAQRPRVEIYQFGDNFRMVIRNVGSILVKRLQDSEKITPGTNVVPSSSPDSIATESSIATTKATPIVKVTVRITSEPPGAEIYVDEVFVGSTPSTISLIPGECSIRITRPEYSAWERKVRIEPSGSITLNAVLEKERPK